MLVFYLIFLGNISSGHLPENQNDYFGIVFFELNEDLEPIKVITAINTTKAFEVETTGMKDDFNNKIVDISYLYGDNIPELEFEI